MHWFDHASSTLVAGVAILILGGIVAVRAMTTADGTRLYASQTIHRALTDQIQIDLDNLGIGRPGGADAVEEASATRFAFHTVVDTLGTPGLVAYEVTPDGDAFEVRRSIDGATQATWVDVTRFEVALLNESGAPATGPAVRAVEVHVERAVAFPSESPAGGSLADPTVGWTTTVRPIALQYPY